MSGGNCPETPRQKMISMMYLFLTAMLAVNVSSTVLDSFEKVDISLRTNNEIITANNASAFKAIDTEFKKNSTKFGEAHAKALLIRAEADSLFNRIEGYKWLLAKKSEGEEGNPYKLVVKDNVDIGHEVMVLKLNNKPTRSELLKEAIKNYREFLLDEVVTDTANFRVLSQSIIKSLNTDDPPKSDEKDSHGGLNQKWEDGMFSNIPIGAIMPLLTKIQSDVRNTESMALSHLMSQATATDFKVNDINAHLITSSTSLFKGATLEAKALLAATDSTQRPTYELYVDGQRIKGTDKGIFEITASSIGSHEITGSIITKNEDGSDNPLDFDPITFEVAEPIATVSATKMNVLYAGVDNPMSISVPGIPSSALVLKLSDGSTLRPDGVGYIAKPMTSGKDIEILVSARIEDELITIGSYTFRVKSLPPPTAYIRYPNEVTVNGRKITQKEDFSTGRLKKLNLLKAEGVIAKLQDSDFEVSYQVLGFDMTFYDNMGNAKTYSSTNSMFTTDQKNKIKDLSRGEQFFISNVRAKGPDGRSRRLPAIDITLN